MLLLAAIIFIPLSLLDLLIEKLAEAGHEEHGVEVLALLTAGLTSTVSELLGQVLLAGAIALWLAGSADGSPLPLRVIARKLMYGRLILLDLVFVLLVFAAALFLILPGLVVFVFLALAGPVVELEHRRILAALRRSVRLVRTDFWLAFWVLLPVELGSYWLSEALGFAGGRILSDAATGSEIATVFSNVVLSPLFSIAAVLLTLHLIRRTDDPDPDSPVPVVSGVIGADAGQRA